MSISRQVVAIAMMTMLFAATPAIGQTLRIELINFGLYTGTNTGSRPDSGVASGRVTQVSDVHFYAQTTRIPMVQGMRFGIQFCVSGAPDGEPIPLQVVWRHPAPGLRNAQTGKLFPVSTSNMVSRIGRVMFRGYSLNHDWELVPGDWILELWSGHNKLLSRTFTLIRQPVADQPIIRGVEPACPSPPTV
jgi:hypothetical protein